MSMTASALTRALPVKLYRTPDRLTVAAPMVGLHPRDITVEVTASGQLVLRGPVRGITADVQLFHRLEKRADASQSGEPVEETRELLLDEWSVGPYHRTLELPNPVDGMLATATYGNGVLVVTLPIAERTTAAQLSLDSIGIGRGERVGSLGHPIQPSSTAEHVQVAHHAL
jgi:HSP20 family protein